MSIDTREIVQASVIQWEIAYDSYGIAYVTRDGLQHMERAGSKAEAERIVREIGRQRSAIPELFPKDVAAS